MLHVLNKLYKYITLIVTSSGFYLGDTGTMLILLNGPSRLFVLVLTCPLQMKMKTIILNVVTRRKEVYFLHTCERKV